MNKEDIDAMTRDAMHELNRAYGRLMGRQPSYRYYSRTGSLDRYFWTTEKINHKGNPRYVAGIYRHLKTKKQWKLIKKVGFARRHKAKAWSLAMKNKEQSLKTPTQ